MELKELQETELNILNYVDSFCKKHGLKYYLIAGTLIGAVRHKGFIPWDDDIDIVMKREDYMRFVKLWQEDQDERYKVFSLYNNDEWYYPFAKVVDSYYRVKEENRKPLEEIGIWLDVFPLDYYDEKVCNIKKIALLMDKRNISVSDKFVVGQGRAKKNPFLFLVKAVAHFLYHRKNPREYALKIDKEAQKCKEKTDKLFVGPSPVKEKDIFNVSWFEESVDLPFEGKSYSCPKMYHEVLTKRYGDYMTPPPVSEQISHHPMDIKKIK